MKSTKKLLSITNLKKYFPVAKSSVFQKNRLYVRANEDISIDIYEGETLGVVGESGCGKSTLGRVLLQLYPQTAGNTIYYGTTLDDMAPKYVKDTITHLDKYHEKVKKAHHKVEELTNKINEVGEEAADFYLLQDRNLARCDEQTYLNDAVKVVGGFYAVEDKKGLELLLKIHEENEKRSKVLAKIHDLSLEKSSAEEDAETNAKSKASLEKANQECVKYEEELKEYDKVVSDLKEELAAVKANYADNEEFQKYEAMLDEGIDLARLTYDEMRVVRKDLQIIFQDPYSSLNPRFTIGQIIEEGLVTHKFYKHGSEKMRQHIVDTMVKCGLQEYMLYRYPHQFSGGQRQRISIARALAVHPKFVVCDECVSALDVSIQSQIINLLLELKEKENLTYMFISHDLSVVRYISDRICVMYLGSVVELADTDTIFGDPRHPYTVALLSSIPSTDPDVAHKERILLEGNIPSPIKPPSGCKFHTRCFMACEKCKHITPELREIEPGHFVACHFAEKKIDENGNYLLDIPKMAAKSFHEESEQQ